MRAGGTVPAPRLCPCAPRPHRPRPSQSRLWLRGSLGVFGHSGAGRVKDSDSSSLQQTSLILGRGQGDGQADPWRNPPPQPRALSGSKPHLPGDTNESLAHPPLPLAPGPGERWFEAGRISREASRTGTVLSLSADHALWKGCSNPCSSTFHGCQLSAGLREAGF